MLEQVSCVALAEIYSVKNVVAFLIGGAQCAAYPKKNLLKIIEAPLERELRKTDIFKFYGIMKEQGGHTAQSVEQYYKHDFLADDA